jgi:hypothetical protein
MRTSLIRNTLLGAVSIAAITSQAQAGCAVFGGIGVLTCGNTVTTNTAVPTNAPNDRQYQVDTNAGPFGVAVGNGIVVSGNGLAITDIGTTNRGITVTNNGTISVDAGNTPTAGGTAALNITSNNAPVVYNGTGAVTNNAVGDAIEIIVNGTASVTYDNLGAVTAANGAGINVIANTDAGDVDMHAGAVTAAGTGVRIASLSATGGVQVTTDGKVDAGAIGIDASAIGTGDVSVTANGGVEADGLFGIIATADGGGDVGVSGSSAITAANGTAVEADAALTGTVTVNLTGDVSGEDGIVTASEDGATSIITRAVTATMGDGINAMTDGGLIGVTAGGTVTAAGNGIVAEITDVTSNAGISINSGRVDAGGVGIGAQTAGSGGIAVNIAGDITAAGTHGVLAAGNGGGSVGVAATGKITAANGTAVEATAVANGNVVISLANDVLGKAGIVTNGEDGATTITTGKVTATAGDGIHATSEGGAITITANGAVSAVDGEGITAFVLDSGSNSDISITTGAASTVTGRGGINAQNFGAGDITITANGAITATDDDAISAAANGGGNVSITAGGTLTATDDTVVFALATAAGQIDINLTGAISGRTGIDASSEDGAIDIVTGAVTATSGHGIDATSETGAITVTANGAASAVAGTGILAAITDAASANDINVTAASTVTGSAGIDAQTAGGGNVTVQTGGAVTAGTGPAILAASNGGDISVTGNGALTSTGGIGVEAHTTGAGTITITRAAAISGRSGVVTTSEDGDQTITTAAVTGTAGNGIDASTTTGGITINANGAVSAVAGTGILAQIGDAGSTNDITIAAASTVAGLTGINVGTLGSGLVDVFAGGAVSATTGQAIFATSNGGDVNVHGTGGLTSTGNTGLFAGTVGAGEITIDLTGAIRGVRGIVTISDADTQITVGDVTATAGTGIDAFADTGAIEITANGNVSGTTSGISATSDGLKTVTIAAGKTVSAPTAVVFNGAGTSLLINNGTIGAPGSVAVQAAGGPTGIANQSGATLSGAFLLSDLDDTIGNLGTLNLSGHSDFGAGPDLILNQANGRVNIAAATVVDGLETFTNAGTFSLNGNSALTGTAFSNLAGSHFLVTGGAFALNGLATFSNAGAISLMDGAANDRLTIDTNYSASGTAASLTLDVASDLQSSDQLIINGAATGTTTLNVNLVQGNGLLNTDGRLLVDTNAAGTDNAFVLAPIAGHGLVDYALEQRGFDYYLTADVNSSIGEISAIGLVGGDAFYQSLDTARENIRSRYVDAGAGRRFNIWGQLYASNDRYGGRNQSATVFGSDIAYGGRIENHRRGGQVGVDYRFNAVAVGAFGGYGRNKADVGFNSDLKLRGYNYGAYALLGGTTGAYVSLAAQRNNYHLDFDNDLRGFSVDPDGHSTGIEGEGGLRGSVGPVRYDFNAGLSWVHTKVDGFNIDGTDFTTSSADSYRGRLNARAILPALYGAYVDATLLHEFDGNAKTGVVNGSQRDALHATSYGTTGRFEAGLGGSEDSHALLSIYGTVGDVKGFGVRAGLRL